MDDLTQEYRGRIVSIEMRSVGPPDSLRAHNVPLEGLSLSLRGHEDVISIVVREQALQHTVHTVRVPLHMTFEQEGDVARSLLIESEDGGAAIVRFHSVSVPETVQGQTTPEAGG